MLLQMCVLTKIFFRGSDVTDTKDFMIFFGSEQKKQGRSKVFTTGQARFKPEHYAIKCVGGR